MPVTRESDRVAGLDGLRGLAIAFVVVAHVTLIFCGVFPGALGTVGVDLFFVLSGYLITGLLLAEHRRNGRVDLLAFWVRRACRLLPALLVMVTVVELFRVAIGVRWPSAAEDWTAMALYSSNWLAISGHPMAFLGQMWSLAVEEQFYLVWPLVVIAAGASRRRLGMVVVGGMVSITFLRVWLWQTDSLVHLHSGTDSRGLAILAGCALALAMTAVRPGVRAGWLALVVLAATGVAQSSPGYLLDGWLLGLPAAVAATAWCLRGGLTWGPLVLLGRRSYAVYLWHFPLLAIGLTWAGARWSPQWWIALVVALGVTWFVAQMSWRWIEAPAQSWGRAWSSTRMREATATLANVGHRLSPVAEEA